MDLIAHLQGRQDAYLSDLQAITSLDSYSYDKDDVNRVVEWLAARLTQMGFTIERFPQERYGDNLRATRQGRGQGKIMLLGHSDTVFPRGTRVPMHSEGEKILGSGTCDMKAGLLAGIYAVEALDALTFNDYEKITFLVVSDEEIGDRSSIPLIRETCRGHDAVFTLEAARANGDIVTSRKGVIQCKAEIFGKAAHSGVEPEKGRSAILAAAHYIVALQALNAPERHHSLNVGLVKGGQQLNIVPDYACVEFEVRAFDHAGMEEMVSRAQAVLAQAVVPDVRVSFSSGHGAPPMPRTPETVALEAQAIRHAAELGFVVKGAATGGFADAAYAAEEGVPALDGLGPIGGLDHSPNEYIIQESIMPRIALLARMLMTTGKTA